MGSKARGARRASSRSFGGGKKTRTAGCLSCLCQVGHVPRQRQRAIDPSMKRSNLSNRANGAGRVSTRFGRKCTGHTIVAFGGHGVGCFLARVAGITGVPCGDLSTGTTLHASFAHDGGIDITVVARLAFQLCRGPRVGNVVALEGRHTEYGTDAVSWGIIPRVAGQAFWHSFYGFGQAQGA